jgi:hypothetical protein
VGEFIVEIEGPPKNCDVTRWGQFTDIKDIKKEMFQRLETQFENWTTEGPEYATEHSDWHSALYI